MQMKNIFWFVLSCTLIFMCGVTCFYVCEYEQKKASLKSVAQEKELTQQKKLIEFRQCYINEFRLYYGIMFIRTDATMVRFCMKMIAKTEAKMLQDGYDRGAICEIKNNGRNEAREICYSQAQK